MTKLAAETMAVPLAFLGAQLARDPWSAPRRLKKSIIKLAIFRTITWRERRRVKLWVERGDRAWDRDLQVRAEQDKREGREAFVPPPAEKSTADLTVETMVFHCYGKNPW
jgi:hypothetical protein